MIKLKFRVSGRVDGNAIVVFGDLLLDGAAEVTGKVVNVLGRYDQNDDPQVGGVVVVSPFQMGPEGKLGGWLAGGTMTFLLSQAGFLCVALLSLLVVALVPTERLESVLRSLRDGPVMSFGVGFLIWISVSALSVLLVAILVLTVIGIPVAVLVVLGLGLLAVVAIAVVATQVGGKIFEVFGGSTRMSWGRTLAGLLILQLVPFLGTFVGLWEDLAGFSRVLQIAGVAVILVAFLFGLGALSVSRLGTRRSAG